MHHEMTTFDTFEDVYERGLRGEYTHPFPGHVYCLLFIERDGSEVPMPVTFDTPESAALFLMKRMVPILERTSPGHEWTFSIAVLLPATVN